MQTVLFTFVFERQAKAAGLVDEEVQEIAAIIAADPTCGDLMPGTGGARKLRHRGRGKGKSGGYRTIHYFAGDGIPIFLLALIDKGRRSDLSMAEKSELSALLPRIAEAYGRRK